MIKVGNCHRDSVLSRMYMTFDTDNTATGAQFAAVICPVEARVESVEYTLDLGCTASLAGGLHTVVYSVGKATTLIDNSMTGALSFGGGLSASNGYKKISSTSTIWNTAGTVITVNISASGNVGIAHGIVTLVLNHRNVK